MKTKKKRWTIAFKESDVVRELKLIEGEALIDQMGIHRVLTPDEAYREYTRNLRSCFINSVNKIQKSTGVEFPHSRERARRE